MKHAIQSAFLAIIAVYCQASVYAAPVTFVLTNAGGSAGAAFAAGNTFTASGVTVSRSVSTTLGSGTGTFSATSSGSGVDSAGITLAGGDAASELDAGETVTFTFTFSSPLTVSLSSFDFGGVGANSANDGALVSFNGGSNLLLETGSVNFNGSTDIWSPNLTLISGNTLTVAAQQRIAFEAFTLEVTAVPEPSSIALLGAVGAFVVARRRKWVLGQ